MNELIPILFTLLAGCVGIVGGTWNKGAIWSKKLTGMGWLSFIVIISTTIYTVNKTLDSENAKKAYKDNLSYIIGEEVNRSTDQLLEPFKMLYVDYLGGNFIPTESITLEELLLDKNLLLAQNACFALRPTNYIISPDQGTWNNIFSNYIRSGVVKLENLQEKYSSQMTPELHRAIYELLENGDMTYYKNYKESPELVSQIPECTIGQLAGRHKQYLNLIQKINIANKSNVL